MIRHAAKPDPSPCQHPASSRLVQEPTSWNTKPAPSEGLPRILGRRPGPWRTGRVGLAPGSKSLRELLIVSQRENNARSWRLLSDQEFCFEALVLGDLTFDLEQIYVKDQDANTLTLAGNGFFNRTGFDRTSGTFEFTGTSSGGCIASEAATPRPEPVHCSLRCSGAIRGLRRVRRRTLPA